VLAMRTLADRALVYSLALTVGLFVGLQLI
jgi:hypothetical protein